MSGLKIAALYGFFPHRLGFCGPREKSATSTLLRYLLGKETSETKIRKVLEDFEGAFPYYKLIAKSNGIKDPFNERVVKAYWVGNQLLEKVPISSLREMIAKEFSRPGLITKKSARRKAREIPLSSKPHHSFHVLVIGSVTGRIILKGRLIDFCRISWGRVKKIKDKKIIVEYQPLIKKKKFQLDQPVKKEIVWNKNFLPKIKIGDWISVHWNQPIQILDKKELISLKKYTQRTINSLNG